MSEKEVRMTVSSLTDAIDQILVNNTDLPARFQSVISANESHLPFKLLDLINDHQVENSIHLPVTACILLNRDSLSQEVALYCNHILLHSDTKPSLLIILRHLVKNDWNPSRNSWGCPVIGDSTHIKGTRQAAYFIAWIVEIDGGLEAFQTYSNFLSESCLRGDLEPGNYKSFFFESALLRAWHPSEVVKMISTTTDADMMIYITKKYLHKLVEGSADVSAIRQVVSSWNDTFGRFDAIVNFLESLEQVQRARKTYRQSD